MGKRYYCDYCDRSFQDNMHNRKKHLNGVQHHRAKKAWFDHFRDSAAILSEEQAKMPCRKFLQTGNCGFGPSCRFSHMSEEDMESLKRQMDDEKRHGEEPEDRSSSERRVEEWLCRREKRRSVLCSGGVVEEKEDEEEEDQTRGDVPPQLLTIPDLPPSLLPPPPGGWRLRLNTDWG